MRNVTHKHKYKESATSTIHKSSCEISVLKISGHRRVNFTTKLQKSYNHNNNYRRVTFTTKLQKNCIYNKITEELLSQQIYRKATFATKLLSLIMCVVYTYSIHHTQNKGCSMIICIYLSGHFKSKTTTSGVLKIFCMIPTLQTDK
jgi:hypothetical protein